MITIENLEKELKTSNLSSLYLLYGEETFLLENSLKKIKALFGECIKGINYILIDEQNISELIPNIETPSFSYDKKLIIAKNTMLFKKDAKKKVGEVYKVKEKLIEYINKNIEIINSSVILVFVEEEAEKQELYDLIDKNGIVCKFDYQKPFQLQQRLKFICNSYKVQIDDKAISYLIECVGISMQDLINEIRKLIEYAGPDGVIKEEDVDKLVIKKIESVIFDLTDNLGKKDINKSLQVLKDLIYEKEPIIKILITLYNHFKKLYITKLAINSNKDIMSSLNLKPNQTFLVNKYKMQSKYFSESELRIILQELTDLDYNFKIGKIDIEVGLETLICRYCS